MSEQAPSVVHVARTPPLGLAPGEARVLGALIEKQRTTPDAYPLSLNALRLACNQSTNRDPVVSYDDEQVRDALHRLERRGMVRLASGAGSRAAKFRHLLADALPLDRGEEAIVCVLLLRGAQTPGELKQRCERMHAFATVADVQETLQALIGRGLAERLGRRPGQKEDRYRELIQEPGDGPGDGDRDGVLVAPAGLATAGEAGPTGAARSSDLEARVAALEREVAALRSALDGSHSHSAALQRAAAAREGA
jgi:uncharacterized protein YceH (UPF0502 family)